MPLNRSQQHLVGSKLPSHIEGECGNGGKAGEQLGAHRGARRHSAFLRVSEGALSAPRGFCLLVNGGSELPVRHSGCRVCAVHVKGDRHICHTLAHRPLGPFQTPYCSPEGRTVVWAGCQPHFPSLPGPLVHFSTLSSLYTPVPPAPFCFLNFPHWFQPRGFALAIPTALNFYLGSSPSQLLTFQGSAQRHPTNHPFKEPLHAVLLLLAQGSWK